MSDIDDNPFRSPASDIGYPDGKPFDLADSSMMRVDGKFLVVKSGVVLPRYCVKTNAPIPESSLRKKTLTWCPPYVFALVVLGGLIVIVAYFLVRKRCHVTYGTSAQTQRKYKTRLIVKSLIAVGLFVSLPLTAGLNDTASTVMVILFILSIVALLLGNSPLSITKHKKGEFWISGCSKEFLARIPDEVDSFALPANA